MQPNLRTHFKFKAPKKSGSRWVRLTRRTCLIAAGDTSMKFNECTIIVQTVQTVQTGVQTGVQTVGKTCTNRRFRIKKKRFHTLNFFILQFVWFVQLFPTVCTPVCTPVCTACTVCTTVTMCVEFHVLQTLTTKKKETEKLESEGESRCQVHHHVF